jgi:hypothetical protein
MEGMMDEIFVEITVSPKDSAVLKRFCVFVPVNMIHAIDANEVVKVLVSDLVNEAEAEEKCTASE